MSNSSPPEDGKKDGLEITASGSVEALEDGAAPTAPVLPQDVQMEPDVLPAVADIPRPLESPPEINPRSRLIHALRVQKAIFLSKERSILTALEDSDVERRRQAIVKFVDDFPRWEAGLNELKSQACEFSQDTEISNAIRQTEEVMERIRQFLKSADSAEALTTNPEFPESVIDLDTARLGEVLVTGEEKPVGDGEEPPEVGPPDEMTSDTLEVDGLLEPLEVGPSDDELSSHSRLREGDPELTDEVELPSIERVSEPELDSLLERVGGEYPSLSTAHHDCWSLAPGFSSFGPVAMSPAAPESPFQAAGGETRQFEPPIVNLGLDDETHRAPTSTPGIHQPMPSDLIRPTVNKVRYLVLSVLAAAGLFGLYKYSSHLDAQQASQSRPPSAAARVEKAHTSPERHPPRTKVSALVAQPPSAKTRKQAARSSEDVQLKPAPSSPPQAYFTTIPLRSYALTPPPLPNRDVVYLDCQIPRRPDGSFVPDCTNEFGPNGERLNRQKITFIKSETSRRTIECLAIDSSNHRLEGYEAYISRFIDTKEERYETARFCIPKTGMPRPITMPFARTK